MHCNLQNMQHELQCFDERQFHDTYGQTELETFQYAVSGAGGFDRLL